MESGLQYHGTTACRGGNEPLDFGGIWVNQFGSTLELCVTGNAVTGRFESAVGDENQTVWVGLCGRVLNDLITFNVAYERYHTVISWTGRLSSDGGKPIINALWLHVSDTSDDQQRAGPWSSTRIGADVFRRA